ncbi:hypothetical protein HA466_0074200 [Hirschfeldia incana]|nr:hypothetical protein HA466_0074200 [Hirschfeldia incana]KAJ0258666.1 hypothetical protein HA466_0074200 [Hirschfeldia incana]
MVEKFTKLGGCKCDSPADVGKGAAVVVVIVFVSPPPPSYSSSSSRTSSPFFSNHSSLINNGDTRLSLSFLSASLLLRSYVLERKAVQSSVALQDGAVVVTNSKPTEKLKDGLLTIPLREADMLVAELGGGEHESTVSITVVGASGDLAKKIIFPALFALHYEGCLPKVIRERDVSSCVSDDSYIELNV